MIGLSIFLFVAFLMLFLGGVVFVHNPKARTHQFFLLGVVFWVIWMVTNYLENVQTLLLPVREFFLRTDFAAGPIANIFIALFVLYFLAGEGKVSRAAKLLAVLPGLFLAIVSFTTWHLPVVFFAPTGEINFEEGWTFPIYALVVILYFLVPVILLLRARRRAPKKQRGQVTSIAVGLMLTAIVTLGVNLFLQNVLPVELFRIGIYGMLFFELGVAYTIVRHEFLRIQLVLVELLLLGILATLLTRTILATTAMEAVITFAFLVALLILGFAMVGSFLKEIEQRRQLEELTYKLAVTNDKLVEANKKLKELDALKTEFLSIASHQLRTPLAVMKGYVTMLQDGMLGALKSKQVAALQTVRISTEQLILLINHLLDLTRIESGRLTVRLAPADVCDPVGWVVSFLAPRAKEKGLRLAYQPCEAPPVRAKIDEEKFKEVVMNLIDNAIKYTEKGTVTVSVGRVKDQAVLIVKDTGYGLTAADTRHMFEKFSRGSASKNVRTTSGLGLYVVKKLVEAMKGTVTAESDGKGKGATFTVTLPRLKGKAG